MRLTLSRDDSWHNKALAESRKIASRGMRQEKSDYVCIKVRNFSENWILNTIWDFLAAWIWSQNYVKIVNQCVKEISEFSHSNVNGQNPTK